jgi:nitrogen fixation protein NifB
VNESRPGVTSSVLTPQQAVLYLQEVLDKAPDITVAGIAGPGDAFAQPEVTMPALRLIRETFPELLLCLATNGLDLAPYVSEIADLGVSHVTVTVNAVDPEIGAKIYAWVRDGKTVYRGLAAAQLLLQRQLAAVADLKAHGIIVKVNTIVIPGINDQHVPEVSRAMKELGVDIQNCMSMYPNQGTPFESIGELDPEELAALRHTVGKYIPQMKHCTRCRADAVGLLEQDRSLEFRECLSACSQTIPVPASGKPFVAVATMEGILVNQHLGEAHRFQVWGQSSGEYQFIEERKAPERGAGVQRWYELAELLHDCRAVMVSGIGEIPAQVLRESGIVPIEMTGFIQMGLDAVFQGENPTLLKGRRQGCSKGMGCSGSGEGCG